MDPLLRRLRVFCDYHILRRPLPTTSLISATEAVRRFSEIINNVRYRGERYTVVRGGQPVATIAPVAGPAPGRRLVELPALVQALPRLAPDDTSFTDDVLATAAAQPLMPRAPGWE